MVCWAENDVDRISDLRPSASTTTNSLISVDIEGDYVGLTSDFNPHDAKYALRHELKYHEVGAARTGGGKLLWVSASCCGLGAQLWCVQI